jgi:hypothetical protein
MVFLRKPKRSASLENEELVNEYLAEKLHLMFPTS